MGVLNVTPDSFSDGGRYLRADDAVAHGMTLARLGADLVDIGGESTRPGAQRPSVEEELARVLPAVRALSTAGVVVSVDTMRSEVAAAAVEAGAMLVNDVSGGKADPEMLGTVADLGVAYVLMHWRAHSDRMQQHATYADVVTDVVTELTAQRDAALAAGIAPERIALDPGIGFSKTTAQNWELLAGLEDLQATGHPVLVATSRKRFLGELLAEGDELRPALERDDATNATTALAAQAGAWGVRVHDVRAAADTVRAVARWQAAAAERLAR